MKSHILDAEYLEKDRLRFLIKNGGETLAEDFLTPYFYYSGREKDFKEDADKVEKIEKHGGLLKVYVKEAGFSHELEHKLKGKGDFYEYDIPIYFRYFIDKNLFASRQYEIDVKDGKVRSIKDAGDSPLKLKMVSFDLEVYNKGGMPDPKKDPILMIGTYDGEEKKTFFWTKEKGSEKEMIDSFISHVKKKNYDIIVGYNSGNFDFPYLKKRCGVLRIPLDLGRDGSEVMIRRGGVFLKADVFGRVLLDAFESIEFLTGIGAMKLPSNDLDSVYREFFKKEKIQIEGSMIYDYWEKGGKSLELLKEYNMEDAMATYEIGEEVLPLFIEISKVVGFPLYEVSRMSTAQMVEWLLVREAFEKKEIVPRRPREEAVAERMHNPIKGAFVKLPEAGLHERIAICDFRSLYPSIIISHNISPDTLNCKCCKDAYVASQRTCMQSDAVKDGRGDQYSTNVAPEVGHRFCTKKTGILPQVLKELIEIRAEAKRAMKKLKEGTAEYRTLHFKQWGLKILLNSSYGYLGYGRARWYSREAAESVTAWGRHYIHDVISKAEKEGFKVLYGDTDGYFLKLNEDQKVEDVKKFVEKINKALPERMELEFEGYYPRGIFVAAKSGLAAKKRYALIRDDGTIEIVGFEFVRRDWSQIAKRAQEKVIQAVLREGKPQKAVEAVKKIIDDLRDRKVPQEDLVIHTQVVRKVSSYEQQAPHVKAAKKLIEAGFKVPAGSDLEFIVIKGNGSISDRSIPVQLIKPKMEYDPEYYIKNQVFAAVMKILAQLGVKEEDLLADAKQSGLSKWV